MSSDREEFVLRSPAKINWMLRVPGRRDDGFHEIETVFQTISLEDRIICREADEDELTSSDVSIPLDSSNLVSRSVAALRGAGASIPPLAFHLEKVIPSGGGLGGGSSNAASVLEALRDRYAPDLGNEQLRVLALELGSDVPFFLEGGTCYATGRGERLTRLEPVVGVRLLVVLPEERVSTAEAYALLGRDELGTEPYLGIERVRELISGGPFSEADQLTNDFEAVIFDRLPRLREIRERLIEEGAGWARMSGSGSTVVGAFRDEESRQRAFASFRDLRVIPAETTG